MDTFPRNNSISPFKPLTPTLSTDGRGKGEGEFLPYGTGSILLKGVRTHNLKNIDVTVPHGTLVVITGVSGSGKSSLAFDTLYAEGRRRYVESLSAYSRQFLERVEKPDLDFVSGILPAIAIEAKNVVTNARSTVGTQTELNDYLRLLFARIGVTYCSSCGEPVESDTPMGIFEKVDRKFHGKNVTVAFPINMGKKAQSFAREIFGEFQRQGFLHFLVSGKEVSLEQMTKRSKKDFEDVLVVVDQLELKPANKARFIDSLESAFKYGKGLVSILPLTHQVGTGSDRLSSPKSFTLAPNTRSTFREELDVLLQKRVGDPRLSAKLRGRSTTYFGGKHSGMTSSAPEPVPLGKGEGELKFSNRFHCASCNIEYRTPNPNSFSFNSPLGACPECQGFGRIITIDQNLVVPNPNLSIAQGAIEPWTKPSTSKEWKQLKEFCKRKRISLDQPFSKLKREEQKWILEGCDDRDFFSVRDFFKYLEKKTYKMHVRIFLSKYRGYLTCPKCYGTRLKPEALAVKINQKNIADLSMLTIESLKHFFDSLTLSEHDQAVADAILLEIKNRLSFLVEVGLGYLTLDRLSRTLSGGEAQRIHLAASLGSALVDTLYVLDEPSVGLHERDNALLIQLLRKLKSLGNTVVVVEHDRTMIETADQIIDLGPLGGERGGEIVFSGSFAELPSAKNSYTARYFRNELKIERSVPLTHQVGTGSVAGQVFISNSSKQNLSRPEPVPLGKGEGGSIHIHKAREHNLKGISLEIPLHQLVVITGVSGSGKSTLMYDILYANYKRFRGRPVQDIGHVERIDGWHHVQDLLLIDQSPIGRTPRSNPVTYVKAFDQIRKIFAQTREAKARRLTASDFSFNVPGGRCDQCEGDGTAKIEMHFLADIYVTCDGCGGSRYQSRILEIRHHGKNIREVLDMTIEGALDFFKEEPKICDPLLILTQVGLGYLRLGQAATTLSGGEAQRLKLASELLHMTNNNLLYLFDEPTTGLHYYDIAALLLAFETLLKRGHSICVIEHNMEIIKCADYVIDLGPEGGEHGGEVVYAGTLSGLLKEPRSHTGVALRKYLR